MSYPLAGPRGVLRDSRGSESVAPSRWPEPDRQQIRTAAELMVRNPDRVAGDDSLIQVAGRMRSLLTAFLSVCDGAGELLGIISFRDVHHALRDCNPIRTTAASLAAMPAVTLSVHDPVTQVWELMAQRRMWLLPVLDGRRLVGTIHYAIAVDPRRTVAVSLPKHTDCHRTRHPH